MGIQDGKAELGISRNNCQNSCHELRGLTLGVDGMLWLSQMLTSHELILAKINMIPRQDITSELCSKLTERCNIWRAMDVTLLFVFDGCRNPTKSATNDERQKKKKDAKDRLIDALKHEGGASVAQISNWYKAATSIDDEIVAITLDWCNQNGVRYIQAPMESDPLLFSLESQSIIDGIISEDSDYIYLGCRRVVLDVSYHSIKHHGNDRNIKNCNICTNEYTMLKLATKIQTDNNLANYEPTFHDLVVYGTLLGSDFFQIDKIGKVKAWQIFLHYLKNKQSTLDFDALVSSTSSIAKGFNENHQRNLKVGVHSLLYGLVWKVEVTNMFHSPRLAFWDNSFTLALTTMRDMPVVNQSRISLLAWKRSPFDKFAELLNYYLNFDISNSLLTGVNWKDKSMYFSLASFKINGRTNQPLERVKYHEPKGSKIDFDSVHPTYIPSVILVRWLQCRGITVRNASKIDKRKLIDTVNAAKKQGELCKVINIQSQPLNDQYIDWGDAINTYMSSDDGKNRLEWSKNLQDILKIVSDKLVKINEDTITEIFGKWRSGVKQRAHTRVVSGHFDISTIKYTKCKIKIDNNNVTCIVLCIDCVPSYKSQLYNVMLLFQESDGSYIGSPFSRCCCPAGRVFCSHMLGFIEILYLIQQVGDKIQNLLPKPVGEVSEPVSLDYYLKHSKTSKEEIDLLKSKFGSINKKLIYSNTNDNANANANANDSDTNDNDNDTSDNDNDINDNDSSDSDSDQRNNEVNEMEEYIRFLNLDSKRENDEYLIINEANKMIKDAVTWDTVTDTPELKAKVHQSDIVKTNYEVICGGPNKNRTTKIEQLEMLDRLDDKYHKEKVIDNNNMSYYLKYTRDERAKLLQLLKDESTEWIYIEVGTSKIPPGWYLLADRGFADDTMKYKNLNSILSPCFLEGRKQFTIEEIKKDIPLCKLRYSSECIFSRVTDLKICSDTVAVNNFHIFNEAVAWGHARNNLQQPYYAPSNYWDYILEERGAEFLQYLQIKIKKHELYTFAMHQAAIKKKDVTTSTKKRNINKILSL